MAWLLPPSPSPKPLHSYLWRGVCATYRTEPIRPTYTDCQYNAKFPRTAVNILEGHAWGLAEEIHWGQHGGRGIQAFWSHGRPFLPRL